MTTQRTRSLADDLRRRSAEDLCALVRVRPDLIDPVPQSLGHLSVRATAIPSVTRALDQVDEFGLQVLAAMGTLPEPVSPVAVASALDPAPLTRVAETMHSLWLQALVWGDTDAMHVVRTVRETNTACHTSVSHPAFSPRVLPAPTHRDSSAIAHALDALTAVALLGFTWETQPPAALRGGGISTRDITVTARAIGCEPDDAELWIDLATRALLVGRDRHNPESWLPTAKFDDWLHASGLARWQELVEAWLATDDLHEYLIDVLNSYEGSIPTEDVLTLVDERFPRTSSPARTTQVLNALRVMDLLGLVVGGSLAMPGRTLTVDLPEPIEKILLQADLTAVAPGPLTPEINRIMRLVADVESTGSATVFRFKPSTISRALATGMTAEGILGFLTSHSLTPMPQPLAYIVNDLARQVTHVDPPTSLRAPTPAVPSIVSVDAAVVVRVVMESDGEAAPPPLNASSVKTMPAGRVVAIIRDAVLANARLRIGYAESTGVTSEHSIEPIRLASGRLTAYDHSDDSVRTFAVSRITGAVPA